MTLEAILLSAVAISPSDSTIWQLPELAFDNPAVKQWMLPDSHSRVAIIGDYSHSSEKILPLQGNGEYRWGVDASSYMKSGKSTVWGSAHYDNGRQTGRILNETSDPEMVYPYFTIDTIGGPMQMEHYSFSGGYATTNGKWAWGATASYDAGLYYRARDPRPRNTTGKLNLSVGGGYRVFSDYFAAASFAWMKYKQSNDIDFKSEMGVEKIYHYTGLGNHYVRFVGTGYDCSYTGHSETISLNLYPQSGKGFSVSAAVQKYSLNKILTELNKLPLADVRQYRFDGQVSWVSANGLGAVADVSIWRRRGYENIFGDASSGIYPVIGRFHRYSHTGYDIKAKALKLWHLRKSTLFTAAVGAGILNNEFVYVTPAQTRNATAAQIQANTNITMPIRRWRAALALDYKGYIPYSTLRLADSVFGGPVNTVATRASLSAPLTSKLTINISATYSHTAYRSAISNNAVSGALAIIF